MYLRDWDTNITLWGWTRKNSRWYCPIFSSEFKCLPKKSISWQYTKEWLCLWKKKVIRLAVFAIFPDTLKETIQDHEATNTNLQKSYYFLFPFARQFVNLSATRHRSSSVFPFQHTFNAKHNKYTVNQLSICTITQVPWGWFKILFFHIFCLLKTMKGGETVLHIHTSKWLHTQTKTTDETQDNPKRNFPK